MLRGSNPPLKKTDFFSFQLNIEIAQIYDYLWCWQLAVYLSSTIWNIHCSNTQATIKYCQQFNSKIAALILSRVVDNMTALYNAVYYYGYMMATVRILLMTILKCRQIAGKLLLNVIISWRHQVANKWEFTAIGSNIVCFLFLR